MKITIITQSLIKLPPAAIAEGIEPELLPEMTHQFDIFADELVPVDHAGGPSKVRDSVDGKWKIVTGFNKMKYDLILTDEKVNIDPRTVKSIVFEMVVAGDYNIAVIGFSEANRAEETPDLQEWIKTTDGRIQMPYRDIIEAPGNYGQSPDYIKNRKKLVDNPTQWKGEGRPRKIRYHYGVARAAALYGLDLEGTVGNVFIRAHYSISGKYKQYPTIPKDKVGFSRTKTTIQAPDGEEETGVTIDFSSRLPVDANGIPTYSETEGERFEAFLGGEGRALFTDVEYDPISGKFEPDERVDFMGPIEQVRLGVEGRAYPFYPDHGINALDPTDTGLIYDDANWKKRRYPERNIRNQLTILKAKYEIPFADLPLVNKIVEDLTLTPMVKYVWDRAFDRNAEEIPNTLNPDLFLPTDDQTVEYMRFNRRSREDILGVRLDYQFTPRLNILGGFQYRKFSNRDKNFKNYLQTFSADDSVPSLYRADRRTRIFEIQAINRGEWLGFYIVILAGHRRTMNLFQNTISNTTFVRAMMGFYSKTRNYLYTKRWARIQSSPAGVGVCSLTNCKHIFRFYYKYMKVLSELNGVHNLYCF